MIYEILNELTPPQVPAWGHASAASTAEVYCSTVEIHHATVGSLQLVLNLCTSPLLRHSKIWLGGVYSCPGTRDRLRLSIFVARQFGLGN